MNTATLELTVEEIDVLHDGVVMLLAGVSRLPHPGADPAYVRERARRKAILDGLSTRLVLGFAQAHAAPAGDAPADRAPRTVLR